MLLRKNKVRIYSLFGLLILLIFTIDNSEVETRINSNAEFEKNLNQNSWNLGDFSILIDDANPNYNWSKTALENDWCSGEGTQEKPYIIENIRLETAYPNKSLIIRNSSVYFVIQNCTLYDCNSGIELFNVNNGAVFNNSFIDMDSTSIYLMKCNDIKISENHLTHVCYKGIAAVNSFNIDIIENNIDTSCGMNYGIYHYKVNYSRIVNNTIKFTGGYNKIGLFQSHYNYIHNNSLLLSGGTGLHLLGSNYNNISKNLISDCGDGIFLEMNSSWNKIIQNIIIQRSTGIYIYKDCGFNLIRNNTLKFYDYDRPYGTDGGIEVYISNQNNITFNSISHYYYGIKLALSNFSYITNNTLFENFEDCIVEFNCMGNIIIDNTCIPYRISYRIIGFNLIIVTIFILVYTSLIKKITKKRIKFY